jgi:hypothetical protein
MVDLTGLDIGDTIRAGDLAMPPRVEVTAHHRDVTVASISMSSAMASDEAAAEDGTAPEA